MSYPVHTFHTEEQITLQTKPSLHKTCKRYNKIRVTTSQPNKHTNVWRNNLDRRMNIGNNEDSQVTADRYYAMHGI